MSMRVKVLFFGMLKDIAGRVEEQVELAPGARLSTLFEHYAGEFPRLRDMAGSIVMARNHEFSPLSTALAEGDEVAFLPPVSGGADPYTHEMADGQGNFYALTRLPIDSREAAERILRGEDGALITFEGTVRNNTKGRPTRFLEYECYEAMAIKMMAGIGSEIARTFEIGHIAMIHRLGRLEIGETSVSIIVTAPHRKAAFAAALEGINRLKRVVPIWKKEYFSDGEVWVEGEWDEKTPLASHG
jgi:molybdopterin synthase catalytic subunit/molybdopterin converting factor small subunit